MVHASYELRLGEDRFRIEVAEEEIRVARGDADQPDATIDTDPDTLGSVLWGGQSRAAAQRAGGMAIEGDKEAAQWFVRLFPIPASAAALSPG